MDTKEPVLDSSKVLEQQLNELESEVDEFTESGYYLRTKLRVDYKETRTYKKRDKRTKSE